MIMRQLLPGRLVLADSILDEASLAALALFKDGTFKDVEIDSFSSIWKRNASLNPQVGTTVMWAEDSAYREVIEALPRVIAYPTGTAVDAVLERAKQIAVNGGILTPQQFEQEYAGIVASFYRYPPGSRLIWHTDEAYMGAFSAYLSGNWNSNWGGHFAFRRDASEEANGIASVVEPRANRMVVFAAGLLHSILSVANDASEPRVALSGFFVKKNQAESLLQRLLSDLERPAS